MHGNYSQIKSFFLLQWSVHRELSQSSYPGIAMLFNFPQVDKP